jgi:transcriptional regulator with XRE-family HTH domain
MPVIRLTQGQRIRLAREWAKLDQAELALKVHVSRAALSAWENDQNKKGVSYNDLRAIADATGREIEFFTGKEAAFTLASTDRKPRQARHRWANMQVTVRRHPLAA